MAQLTKVWDGFIRGYHWLQLALLGSLWFTARQGYMELHLLLAYVLLPLLLTRLIWGLWGSQSARFAHFVRPPRKAWQFLAALRNNQAPPYLGHNPAGGLMVVALLVVIAMQLVTGLFANDAILTEGPLVQWVSLETSDLMTQLHHLNFNLMLGLSAVHVLAIIIHRLRGERLVQAMFTGKKTAQTTTKGESEAELKLRSPWLAWCVFAVAVIGMWLLWGLEQWQAFRAW